MKQTKSVVKLILILLGVGIILFSTLICLCVNYNLHSGLTSYIKEELEAQSVVVTQEMMFTFETTENTAGWLKTTYEEVYTSKGFDIQEMNRAAEYAKEFFSAENIIFFNKDGVQVSSPKYGSVPNPAYVAKALGGNDVKIYEKNGGKIFATIILPLQEDGTTFGAVQVKSLVTNKDLIETVYDYANCDIAFFYGSRYFLTSFKNLEGEEVPHPEYVERADKGEYLLTTESINGIKYISYYFPFHDQSGSTLATIFIGKQLEIADHVAVSIFIPLLIIIVICSVILVTLLGLTIWFKMLKPLKNIRKAVSNLSSGDADLTARINVSTNDEFGQVGEEINKFIAMLQSIIRELGLSQDTLNTVGQELGNNASDSASATAQILANIESVRHQSENQSSAVKNTSTVLENTSKTVDDLLVLIDNQTAGITESSAAIEEMLSNISTVTRSVEKMADSYSNLGTYINEGQVKLGSVDQKVQEIANQSQMLMQANTIISQIASETNLLAMNAAIEASHAGDAGKGFSVVADEIRKLAENSSVQSKRISSELKKITSSITNVVQLSHDSQEAFGTIVSQLDSTNRIMNEISNAMDEQQLASKQVFEALSDMKDHSMEVSDKSKVMNEEIKKVSTDMTSVDQISTTILGSMDEMTAGMQQIGNATQNVSDLAKDTQSHIDDMNSKLCQFNV